MRTADLIDSLASDAALPAPARPGRMIGVALALGAAAALAILVGWLGLRPLHEAMRSASFWMKAGYTGAIAAVAAGGVISLARPGGRLGAMPALWALAVGALALLAAVEMSGTPSAERGAAWLGHSWRSCSWHIVALAVPVYLALVVALRRLAPTRLGLAGAAAGCLAGAVGATVYGLYCEETAPAFVLVWYTVGIAACAGVGALAGRRLLRW